MAPAIVPRSAWGASPLVTPARAVRTPTPECWLHHTGSSGLHGAAGMHALQQNAMHHGYVDLEYSYVVDSDGTIYESRGLGHDTAATIRHNAVSHAVCVMGNFMTDTPSSHVLDVVAGLLVWMHDMGAMSPKGLSGGHRDVFSTACPGDHLYVQIPEINRRCGAAQPTPDPNPTPAKGGAMQMARTSDSKGYWIAAADGGVFSFGNARFYGSIPQQKITLSAPIVGIAARPQGDGYALVGADGAVFCFGASKYAGGANTLKLSAPIVDIEYDGDGDGYWLLGADGGVFSFRAEFYGSAAGKVSP